MPAGDRQAGSRHDRQTILASYCRVETPWYLQETEDQVEQSRVARWFCHLFWQPTPANPLVALFPSRDPASSGGADRQAGAAGEGDARAKAAPGREPLAQTAIHHPTDRGLLVDSVRVLSRFMQRARGMLHAHGAAVRHLRRSLLLTAWRVSRRLHRQLRSRGEDKEAGQKQLYQHLIETSEQMVKQVRTVIQRPRQSSEQVAVCGRREASTPLDRARALGPEDGFRSEGAQSV